jgi:hypothetical protein
VEYADLAYHICTRQVFTLGLACLSCFAVTTAVCLVQTWHTKRQHSAARAKDCPGITAGSSELAAGCNIGLQELTLECAGQLSDAELAAAAMALPDLRRLETRGLRPAQGSQVGGSLPLLLTMRRHASSTSSTWPTANRCAEESAAADSVYRLAMGTVFSSCSDDEGCSTSETEVAVIIVGTGLAMLLIYCICICRIVCW